jgi:hypothetical protein
MSTPTPRRDDELSDIERHLAGWRPDAEGLGADAMLFAAGQAAARRGPRLWPALSLLLAVVAVGLGSWALSERAGRLALAGRLLVQPPSADEPAATTVAAAPAPSYSPSPTDYLHLRRLVEQDAARWLSSPSAGAPPAPPPAQPSILRGGQRDSLPDL